jgi:replicative DNA helicase
MKLDKQQLDALRDLEASILGGIILRPDSLGELPRLEVDDFLDLRHRVVFTAMRNLEADGRPIDVVTVEAEIAKGEKSEAVGGYAFLGELALRVPTTDNVLEYARQVREASLSRRVLDALESVQARAAREVLSGGEVLSMALAALSRIDEDQPDEARPISDLVRKRLKQLDEIAEQRANGSQVLTGFPTGIANLDEKIGGVQPGIVTILAARPGAGKSSAGLSIADASSTAGFGVHLFSLEDTEEAYSDRTIARTSGVPADRLRNAALERQDIRDVTVAISKLRGRRWIVDGRSGITAEEIVRSVRRHKRANATNVVIVDYVQLVTKPHPRMTTHEALSEIVTTLADAAKQDRMAYVVMSQLNRGVEQRTDKRPQLSDLRESGSLEERAKCVIGLYRGSMYGKPVKGIDWDEKWEGHDWAPSDDEHKKQAQVLVLKNSNGRTGVAWAEWNGPTTRLS